MLVNDYEGSSPEPLLTETLEGWVETKLESWRNSYNSNYRQKHEEYNRLWRGIWAAEDKTRESERSKMISPALQQAVESSVAEVEEATFGRGQWFDIQDDKADPDNTDIATLRGLLTQDFKKQKIRQAVAECLIIAAVYGTGIAEVCLEEVKEMAPATQPIMDGQLQAVGVSVVNRTVVKLRPVLPHNFLIDPVATSIESALGCAVDEYVPMHYVELKQEQGIYRKVRIPESSSLNDIESDKELVSVPDNKVRLSRYYGLVPRSLLAKAQQTEDDEEVVDLTEDAAEDTDESTYVEAVVVIMDGCILLKAEENPYMMQDRPMIAFPWDVIPRSFWGRGVCEKGYNSQKGLDAELRARMDALALTTHPMMAIDSTKIPRGMKPEIRPGKVLLTVGDPSNALMPFNFGQVGQITFAQAAEFQKMVQTATGAVDSAGIPGSINGESTAAGISMSLGAIIKRHKRTLINFQESFIIPFVDKAAWRYMQYDPEHYPVGDYNFVATSTLGLIAREYEVTQMVQLMQTMGNDNAAYPLMLNAVIDNMNVSNREELQAAIKQSSQPNPEAQAAQQAMEQAMHQAQMDFQAAQTEFLKAQSAEAMSRAQKYATETQLAPQELELKKIEAATNNLQPGNADDAEFKKRIELANVMLKEREVGVKEKEQHFSQAREDQKKIDTDFASTLSADLGV